MTDVLLTHSYFMRFDKKQWRTMQPYPPLGTLYAASVLKKAGISVSLFDSMMAESEMILDDYIKKSSPKIVAIYDDSFNYLTKMCLGRMRVAAFRMIEIAKKKNCVVVVSSSDSADHCEAYLSRGADYVIKGEGEETLVELCTSILNPGNSGNHDIAGLSFLEDQHVVGTKPRMPIRNLDSLPFPSWELINMTDYESRWRNANGYFSMNIVTTRGCPYGCNWCAKPIYGRGYNSRSAGNVVDELKLLKDRFNPDHIWICDDIFGLKPGWLSSFRDEVDRAKLNIKYKCLSRPDLLLKEDSFSALAHSGCETVWMGAESGSQKILDAMDKGTTIEQIKLATRRLRDNGIRVGYFLQFGYPGETLADVSKTFDLIKEEMPDDVGMSVSYPLPNTKFHRMVEKELGEKRNWHDSDDLAILFPGAFKPHFYKTLHKVLHKLHRLLKILKGREHFTPRTVLVLLFNMFTLMLYRVLLLLERAENPDRVSIEKRTEEA